MQTKDLIRQLLINIGEDPERDVLNKTPERVAEFWGYATRGYKVDIDAVLKESVSNDKYDQMILVKDIDYYSLCEHHLVPFFGKAHIAYIPAGKTIGLSKIPRIVDAFARRLQIQERLTKQVAEAIQNVLQPKVWQLSLRRRISACRCAGWKNIIRWLPPAPCSVSFGKMNVPVWNSWI